MGADEWERHRKSFGSAAGIYERARPAYPPEAVDLLVRPGARRVLDVGAGTGKLTRLLVDRGFEVVAVEPSAGMREEFARALPGVPVLDGSAEALPLDDGSVDAVVVAQAWHWVDPERAVPEVARVLAPRGTLGLVWNFRNDREPWVAALTELLGDQEPVAHGRPEEPVVGAPFGPLERHEVAWRSEPTPDAVVDLVASRSYVITLPDRERAQVLDDVRRLLAEHPDTTGRATVPLPYVAVCYRAVLVS